MKRLLGCLAASLFSFYNLCLFSMMNVLGVYLVQTLHITTSQLGFLSSWDLWGNVLGFIPIGILLDRCNTRIVGISLLTLAIISTFLMGLTDNFYILCLLRFFQGIASAGSLLITMRAGVSFAKHSNKIIGLMIFIALSGGMIGNSGFSLLAGSFGWQNGLKLIAIIGVICLIIMYLFLPDTKSLAKPTTFSLKSLINKYHLWAGCQIGILNSPVFLLGSLFGNHLLLHQTALTVKQTTFISSLLFAGIMIGSPLFGYLADKIGSLKIIVIGYLGLIVCFVLFAIIPNLTFTGYRLLFFIIGCFCCTQNLIYPLIYRKNCESPSTATAMSALIFNSLGAFLQMSFGLFLEVMSRQINLSLLLFPILFLAGILYMRQASA